MLQNRMQQQVFIFFFLEGWGADGESFAHGNSLLPLFGMSCQRCYYVSPQVIAPEEIIDPGVDEQSVMTYLSQFPKAKLKPGAPLKPKLNPKKARAYGPGGNLSPPHF